LSFADQQNEDHLQRIATRNFCIRQLVQQLHQLYFRSQRYADSLQLAVLVSDSRYRIFDCFESVDMKQFFALLHQSILETLKFPGDFLASDH